MYSSNNYSLNGNDLISYPIQPFCSRPNFSIESNHTSSTQETNCALLIPPPPPLSFFQFPSPFEDDHEIFLEQQHHDHSLLHHQSPPEAVVVSVNSKNNNINPAGKAGQGNTISEQIPARRRSSKRDRHSKIKTARGLRDRRMRLSLEVAKRFFGLQDMLGFDKASKTVDWLLNQSKVEIKQLAREKNIHHPSCSSTGVTAKSASSTSECEGVSSLDEVAVSGNQEQKQIAKRRSAKVSRKTAFKAVGRESREKARERARERTKEKMRTRMVAVDHESKQCNEATNHNLNRLGSWNPFETVEECAAGTQSQSVLNPSLDVLNEVEERSSQAKEHLGTTGDQDLAHEDSLVIMTKWCPTMIFNSLNNSGILQEHQFAELHESMGKHWEAYNHDI